MKKLILACLLGAAASLSQAGAKIEREEFGPGSSFHTRYGAGKGEVRIETFSGDATLRLQ